MHIASSLKMLHSSRDLRELLGKDQPKSKESDITDGWTDGHLSMECARAEVKWRL